MSYRAWSVSMLICLTLAVSMQAFSTVTVQPSSTKTDDRYQAGQTAASCPHLDVQNKKL